MNIFQYDAIKKLANIFLKPFEEHQERLIKRIQSYKTALASIANQVNNLGFTSLDS